LLLLLVVVTVLLLLLLLLLLLMPLGRIFLLIVRIMFIEQLAVWRRCRSR
jgi:hypothetical protein